MPIERLGGCMDIPDVNGGDKLCQMATKCCSPHEASSRLTMHAPRLGHHIGLRALQIASRHPPPLSS
jgi:hypothetical protein